MKIRATLNQIVFSCSKRLKQQGCVTLVTHSQIQMKSILLAYRTKDGTKDYGFLFKELGSEIRVYIRAQPSYRGRDEGAQAHRYTDEEGFYICTDKPMKSFQDAKRIAALWAEKTEQYILDGKPWS